MNDIKKKAFNIVASLNKNKMTNFNNIKAYEDLTEEEKQELETMLNRCNEIIRIEREEGKIWEQ